MLHTGILLKDVIVLEEQFAQLTEDGWVIPAWLVYLKEEVIKRDESKFSIYNELKKRWPDASDQALDEVLWLTPFPAAADYNVVKALDRMKERWGDNVVDVIVGEMLEFDTQMAKIHEEMKASEDLINSNPNCLL